MDVEDFFFKTFLYKKCMKNHVSVRLWVTLLMERHMHKDEPPLTLEDVPQPDADLSEITWFAHRMNGYDVAGSFERTADIARNPDPNSQTELRIALFFCARARRHSETPGDSPEMRKLIRQLRSLLTN